MTPVIIQDSVAVAANTTVENLIAQNTGAQRYIRAPFNAIGKLFNNVSSQAVPGLRLELVVDGKTIMDSSDARTQSVVAQLIDPDDNTVEQFFIREGAQIVLRAVNSSGGSLTAYYRIEMHPTDQQMPAQRVTQRMQAIAANTTVQVLSGLRFERPVLDSLLDVFAVASATGLQLEVFVDGQSVAPAIPVPASNRAPINPYDRILGGIEVPADKLIELRVTNTTGGSLNLFWRTMLNEQEFQT